MGTRGNARTIGAYKRTRSQERAHVATYGAAFSREKRHTEQDGAHANSALQCERRTERRRETVRQHTHRRASVLSSSVLLSLCGVPAGWLFVGRPAGGKFQSVLVSSIGCCHGLRTRLEPGPE